MLLMSRMLRKRSALCCTFAVLVVFGCNTSDTDGPSEATGPLEASGENGYFKIVEAATLANRIAVQDVATIAGKRSYVQAGAEAMRLARKGLNMECRVDDSAKPKPAVESLRHFTSLVKLFQLNAEIAQQDQDVDKALNGYLDYVRLGSALSYGGNMMDQQKSSAYMGRGSAAIYAMREILAEKQCRRAIEVLGNVLRRIEPAEVVAQREVGEGVSLESPRRARAVKRQRVAVQMCQAKIGLCTTALAIRLHYLRQGQLPKTLDDLVDTELQQLPIDPWTERPLVYRVEGKSYMLYAVGPDRQDNGGNKMAEEKLRKGVPGGDLFL